MSEDIGRSLTRAAGRLRDPLVGRALLAGTSAALVAVAIVPGLLAVSARLFSWPVAVPRFVSVDAGAAWFLAYDASSWVGPFHALLLVAVLLLARTIVRLDRAAWGVLLIAAFLFHSWEVQVYQSWAAEAPAAMFLPPAVFAIAIVSVLYRHGVLGGVVCYTVAIALYSTPLTYNVAHWYFWRTVVVVLLIGALGYWGFRNVLGKQSAFPAGALD